MLREGDISSTFTRSAITCANNACLWPKAVDGFVYVPYFISPLYGAVAKVSSGLGELWDNCFFDKYLWPSLTADDMDRITIENGMKDIGTGTCIKFVPRTHEASFLDIQPRYGWVHFSVFSGCLFTSAWSWHSDDDDTSFCVPHHKLLVISGTDGRKPDPVAADSWLHVVRGGCPWINARPRLCAWAVSLWPRPIRHHYVEKHHTRLGWKSNELSHFLTFATFFFID